jgi:hypothetical protein
MSAGEYTYLATEIRWEEAPGHKPGDQLVTSDVPGWPVAAFSRKYELQNWIDNYKPRQYLCRYFRMRNGLLYDVQELTLGDDCKLRDKTQEDE